MAKKLYPEESVSDIAAAIREKNGSAERYNVAEMGGAVRAIPTGDTFWTQENRNNLATVLEKVPIVADSADEAASINTIRNSFISALRGGVTPAEPVLISISVTPTSITVSFGTTASQVKDYLTSMTGYYETEGVAGQTTKDLTSQLSSVTVSGTMPTAGNTSTMIISYGGKSTTVSVTMEKAAPTLTGLTATYTGGTVAAGTTLSQLTEVVKATYSDGTTSAALTKGTDYTLSGTLTAGQANTVTVTGAGTYAGFTTSFSVTVEAAATAVTYAKMYIYSSDYDTSLGAMQSPYVQTDRPNARGWNTVGSESTTSPAGTHGQTGNITFEQALTAIPKTIKITQISKEDAHTSSQDCYNGIWDLSADALSASGNCMRGANIKTTLTVNVGDISWAKDGNNYAGITKFVTNSSETRYFSRNCPHGVILEVEC